jgi:hypothetical protein
MPEPPEALGRKYHVFVAVLINVPPAFCASVTIEPFNVTPTPAVMVTTPAPRLRSWITVPFAYATEEKGGTVAVIGLAFEKLTAPPASARTNVSEVPVTARNVNVLNAVFRFAAVRTDPAVKATMPLLP